LSPESALSTSASALAFAIKESEVELSSANVLLEQAGVLTEIANSNVLDSITAFLVRSRGRRQMASPLMNF
jgi:hypothetical protein